MDLQMLLQEFLPPSDEERVQFLVAASSGDATTLDTLLSKPMDPNTTIPFSEKKEMPTRQLWATTGLAPQQLGSSALQLACVGGHTDCARHGKTREKNWSAWLFATQFFKDEVEMYIYPSLSIIIHLWDGSAISGFSCPRALAPSAVASTLRSLVDAKAELETTSAMPRCVVGKALYEASLQGHWEIVQLLAEAKDGWWWCLLMKQRYIGISSKPENGADISIVSGALTKSC